MCVFGKQVPWPSGDLQIKGNHYLTKHQRFEGSGGGGYVDDSRGTTEEIASQLVMQFNLLFVSIKLHCAPFK